MSSARYNNRALRYYDPGRNPQPRHAEDLFRVRSGTRKKRRLPKARRLGCLQPASLGRPSGRQWKRLHKQMRKVWKRQQRARRAGAAG